jgi:putative acetyltransferase
MTLSLRPYLPDDAETLAVIFGESIDDLTLEDYDDEQRAAWMEPILDLQDWRKMLASGLTLVGLYEGEPAGFAQLAAPDTIAMIHVHPNYIGEGVGRLLVDALEKLAAARGARMLKVESSDTARGFFEHLGYEMKDRAARRFGEQWLSRITMTKALGAGAGGPTS